MNARSGGGACIESEDGKAVHMAKAGSGYILQAGEGHLSDVVNTEFVLDMQRKLYRWSAADPEKRFANLFNIVCDRKTLLRAWQRLARTG